MPIIDKPNLDRLLRSDLALSAATQRAIDSLQAVDVARRADAVGARVGLKCLCRDLDIEIEDLEDLDYWRALPECITRAVTAWRLAIDSDAVARRQTRLAAADDDSRRRRDHGVGAVSVRSRSIVRVSEAKGGTSNPLAQSTAGCVPLRAGMGRTATQSISLIDRARWITRSRDGVAHIGTVAHNGTAVAQSGTKKRKRPSKRARQRAIR